MPLPSIQAIIAFPEYQELLAKRRRLVWPLISLITFLYFAFILMVAFAPAALGTPVGNGVISIGMLAGLGLILVTFLVTGIYSHRANRDLESLILRIQQKANEQ